MSTAEFRMIDFTRSALRMMPLTLLLFFFTVHHGSASGGVVLYGGLTELRESGPGLLESDLYLKASSDLIGKTLEWIDLDVFHSQSVRSAVVSPLGIGNITFQAKNQFSTWQSTTDLTEVPIDPAVPPPVVPRFAVTMNLDFTNAPVPSPFDIVDTAKFLVGTFTIDYSGLGLQIGDSVTLDITGQVDFLGFKTTSAVASGSGLNSTTDPLAFEFSNELGPLVRTFELRNQVDPPTVPEPTSGTIFLAMVLTTIGWPRRQRR